MKRASAAILSLLALGIVFCAGNAFAASTGSANFSVDVADTILELTVPNPQTNPIVIDLNPTMTGSAFGTANVTISAATNNQTGYTITMTPDSYYGDVALVRTELVGDEDDYRRIEALEPTTPASTGYTQDTFTSNSWGYRILSNTNYYGIDESNPTISHPAWTTDAPTNGTTHNLTLAAKINAETVSGAYETTLVFTAVTNSTAARDIITFNANGGSGTMENIEVTAGTSATLPANSFTAPTGYRFSGWSTTQNGQGDGVRYYTNKASYTATDTGVNKHVTLYAQWTNLPCSDDCTDPEPDPTTGSVGTTFQRAYEIAYTAMHKGMYEEQHEGQGDYALVYSWPPTSEPYKNYDVRFAMQDMTPEICASVTAMHDDYKALDIRDNKLYHITKMLDGSCWMTQNLDLNLSTSVELNSTTSDLNSSVDDDGTTALSRYRVSGNVIYWQPHHDTIAASSQSDLSPWDNSFNESYSVDVGNWYWTDVFVNSAGASEANYLDNNAGTSFRKDNPYPGNGTHGHLGNYYNWTAAIAGSRTDEVFPKNSICPKGWRLPTFERNDIAWGDFDELFEAYGVENGVTHDDNDRIISTAPIYMVRQGDITSDILEYSNLRGRYWTNGKMYNPYFQNNPNMMEYYSYTFWQPNYLYYFHYSVGHPGLPVRCLAR